MGFDVIYENPQNISPPKPLILVSKVFPNGVPKIFNIEQAINCLRALHRFHFEIAKGLQHTVRPPNREDLSKFCDYRFGLIFSQFLFPKHFRKKNAVDLMNRFLIHACLFVPQILTDSSSSFKNLAQDQGAN